MPFRPATYTEVLTYLADLKYYEQHKDAEHFAHDLVGKQVAQVKVHIMEEWDEDGPYDTIQSVSFHNEEGKSLRADFTLPTWKEYRGSFPGNFDELPYEQQITIASELVNLRALYDEYFNGIPGETTTFDLLHPPEEPKPLFIEE